METAIWRGCGAIRTAVSGLVPESFPRITLPVGKWVCVTFTVRANGDNEQFNNSGVTEHVITTNNTAINPLGSNATYSSWFIIAQRVE